MRCGFSDAKSLGELVANVFEDAIKRTTSSSSVGGKIDYDLCDVEMWPQAWGSTACGFGGISGQAITEAQTIVITCLYASPSILVFHAGRFAYAITNPNNKYYEDYVARHLIGAYEYKGQYEK